MSWVIMSFYKTTEEFHDEVLLPEVVDDDAVGMLVGNYPNLRGDSFQLQAAGLAELAVKYLVNVDAAVFDYFILFRASPNN